MAFDAGSVVAKIVADLTEFKAGLSKAKDEAKSFVSSIKGNFDEASKASKVVALGVMGAGTAIVGFLGAAVKSAAGAETAIAKVDTILRTMGDSAMANRDAVMGAADAAAKLGFDDEDAAVAVATLYQRTGDLTTATKLSGLAMDLARFKSLDMGTATTLVSQVLAGQGRQLKQYGIDLKDTANPLEALGELQTKVAGQAQAYANTLEGSMAAAKVSIGNIMEEIGGVFLPIVTSALQSFNGLIASMGGSAGILDRIKGIFAQIQPYIGLIAAAIIGALIPAAISATIAFGGMLTAISAGLVALAPYIIVAVVLYEAWKNNLFGIRDALDQFLAFILPIFAEVNRFVMEHGGIVGTMTEAWTLVANGVRDLLLAFSFTISATFQGIRNTITGTWISIQLATIATWTAIKTGVADALGTVMAVIQAGGSLLGKAWDGIMQGLSKVTAGVWETIKTSFTAAINWIMGKLNAMIGAFNAAVAKIPGGKTLQIPTVPKLAEGGIVSRPTLALIGEAGPEAVVPLDKAAGGLGGGVSFHFHDSIISSADAARSIMDEAMRTMRPALGI